MLLYLVYYTCDLYENVKNSMLLNMLITIERTPCSIFIFPIYKVIYGVLESRGCGCDIIFRKEVGK